MTLPDIDLEVQDPESIPVDAIPLDQVKPVGDTGNLPGHEPKAS